MNTQDTLIVCGVIAAMFVVILAVGGAGSIESDVGHFFKDTLNGTPLEQPAASIEAAGNDLTASANRAFAFLSGLVLLVGLIWLGSKR